MARLVWVSERCVMGLDAIEITMPVEEAFDIRIEDAEVASIATPRDLIEIVLRKVTQVNAGACLTQRAFNLLRAALLRQLPLGRRDVVPAVRLADLVPQKHYRRPLLGQLAAELGTGPLPVLLRPRWLVRLLAAGCTAAGIGFALLLSLWAPSVKLRYLFVAGAITALVAGYLVQRATHACCTEFPPLVETAGDMARWVMAHKPDLAGPVPGCWTREQVAARVREIVIEQLDCANIYRDDASFVQDLGAD
jgi:acyl carrier protein